MMRPASRSVSSNWPPFELDVQVRNGERHGQSGIAEGIEQGYEFRCKRRRIAEPCVELTRHRNPGKTYCQRPLVTRRCAQLLEFGERRVGVTGADSVLIGAEQRTGRYAHPQLGLDHPRAIDRRRHGRAASSTVQQRNYGTSTKSRHAYANRTQHADHLRLPDSERSVRRSHLSPPRVSIAAATRRCS